MVLGKEHPYTLRVRNNLSTTYRDQCPWQEAEELLSRVPELRKKALGAMSFLSCTESIRSSGKSPVEDINASNALSRIFTDILKHSTLQSTYLMIDVVEECTIDLPFLLDLIVLDSPVYPQVKWYLYVNIDVDKICLRICTMDVGKPIKHRVKPTSRLDEVTRPGIKHVAFVFDHEITPSYPRILDTEECILR
jgi:hypothetical protein